MSGYLSEWWRPGGRTSGAADLNDRISGDVADTEWAERQSGFGWAVWERFDEVVLQRGDKRLV